MTVISIVGEVAAAAPAPAGSAADQAAAKLMELQAKPEWAAKLISKTDGGAEKTEFARLMKESAGADRISSIIDGSAEVPLVETVSEGRLSTYKQLQSVAWLREEGIGDDAIRQVLEGREVSQAEWNNAKALRDDRMSDQEFLKRYLGGNREAAREMTLLNIIIVSGAKRAAA